MIMIGILLVAAGAFLYLAGSLLNLLSPQLSGGRSSFDVYLEVQLGLGAAHAMAVGIGLFLIFEGITRVAPRARPWSHIGALLILAAAVATVAAELVEIAIYANGFPGSSLQYGTWVGIGVSTLFVAGGVGVDLGMVLALFGVARGFLALLSAPTVHSPS